VSRKKDPVFYVCKGKSCRKRKKDHAAVLEILSREADVRRVSCRDICDGPVVGVSVGDGTTWFARVDGEKSREGLLTLARKGEMVKALRKRRC
jgi:hypothetical protein